MRLPRLTQRSEFLAAAEHGRRFHSTAFTAQVRDRAETEGTGLRLGLTASRKAGGAVARNRIRRRLRVAAAQALAAQVERPCDIVLVARPKAVSEEFARLVDAIAVALDKARAGGRPMRGGKKRK